MARIIHLDITNLLQQVAFFEGISQRSLVQLSHICIPKRVPKRATLFSEGDQGYCMYVLAEGSVQLFKSTLDGREIVIKTVKPGEIFGEVILFEQSCYPVSALALSSSLVLMFARRQIDCLLATEAFRRDFIAMLMRKQRYLAERILALSAHDVEDRFFAFLKEHFGEEEKYFIKMSKKDFASAIGTTPETFSRLLLRLKERGLVRWERNTLKLPAGFWER